MPEPQPSGGEYYVIKSPSGEIFVLSTSELAQFKINSADDLPAELGVPPGAAHYVSNLQTAFQLDMNGLLLADVHIAPPTVAFWGVTAQLAMYTQLPEQSPQASPDSGESSTPPPNPPTTEV